MIVRCIGLFFAALVLGGASLKAASDLDVALQKERLRKIYGDFSVKTRGDWQVTYSGQVFTWKWSERGWTCPKDSPIVCSDWVPASFKWWSLGRGWFEQWSPESRLGLEFGTAKIQGAVATSVGEVASNAVLSAEPQEFEHPSDKSNDEKGGFWGRKWALEGWKWKNSKGDSAGIYVSLRDQKVERIDFEGVIEFLEWRDKPGRASPDLERIVLERGGQRMVISRLSK